MIESGRRPRRRVVALRTIGDGEGGTGLRMRRGVGLLPCGEVAAGVAAIGGGDLKIVIVVDVATGAGDIRVACG